MKHAFDVGGIEPVTAAPATQLLAQQQGGGPHVLFAVPENALATVNLPSTFADVLSNRIFIDVLPTGDPVIATCVRQSFALLLAHLVRVVRQQNIAGR